MTIEGDFNTLFLADILQLLCNQGKTGVLTAKRSIAGSPARAHHLPASVVLRENLGKT